MTSVRQQNMEVTLLGTGDVTGMPVPLCDCQYCIESPRRRRSGLLVETSTHTVLFDASPDIREQLRNTNVDNLDAVFITHHHTDHAGGIEDLAPALAVTEFPIYMTQTAMRHFEDEVPHLAEHLDPECLNYGQSKTFGSLEIVPFPVDHARPEFDTLGFALYQNDTKVVYAPDMKQFLPDRAAGEEYRNAELLFIEGSGLFSEEGAGTPEQVRSSLQQANAEKTVLTHFNEHIAEEHTETFDKIATQEGYQLGEDFTSYQL